MHQKKIVHAGIDTGTAKKALIMLHGRGASAADILGLADYLPMAEFSLLAPEATGNTWYPYSFLEPPSRNEPWLSSALALLGEVVRDVVAGGINEKDIYFLGFSQGACLTLEFTARNARRYGGVIAFTGGLIGDRLYPENYKGDFQNTSIFIGSSDPDPHVPVERVNQSAVVLEQLNARVTKKIYDGMGHTINQDEINTVNELFFKNIK